MLGRVAMAVLRVVLPVVDGVSRPAGATGECEGRDSRGGCCWACGRGHSTFENAGLVASFASPPRGQEGLGAEGTPAELGIMVFSPGSPRRTWAHVTLRVTGAMLGGAEVELCPTMLGSEG